MGAVCQGNDSSERDVTVILTPAAGTTTYKAVPTSEKDVERLEKDVEGLSTTSTRTPSPRRSVGLDAPSASALDILKALESFPAPAATADSGSVDNGEHTLSWKDGASYTGSLGKGSLIARGAMHGYGKWTSGDGCSTYTGEWLDDHYHGKGELVTDVGTYDGDFLRGVFDGKGVMHWCDNRYYEGEWRRGKRHGYGLNVSRMGQQRNGIWEQNRFVGREEQQGCVADSACCSWGGR